MTDGSPWGALGRSSDQGNGKKKYIMVYIATSAFTWSDSVPIVFVMHIYKVTLPCVPTTSCLFVAVSQPASSLGLAVASLPAESQLCVSFCVRCRVTGRRNAVLQRTLGDRAPGEQTGGVSIRPDRVVKLRRAHKDQVTGSGHVTLSLNGVPAAR